MTTRLTLSIAATLALALSSAACGSDSDAAGGSPAADAGSEPAAADELGGAGQWTNEQLCALSTAEAVSLQFGVDVEEQPSQGDNDWSSCSWKLADDPLAQAPMRISNSSGFASDSLGGDEQLDIAGADMAAYYANAGGAADVSAVVGDQWLQITFPVGTEGAQEFGTAIASVWVAAQVGG